MRGERRRGGGEVARVVQISLLVSRNIRAEFCKAIGGWGGEVAKGARISLSTCRKSEVRIS